MIIYSYTGSLIRNQEKRRRVLTFLGQGEPYILASVAASLFNITETKARFFLAKLVKEKVLAEKTFDKMPSVYGITAKGLTEIGLNRKTGLAFAPSQLTRGSQFKHTSNIQLLRSEYEHLGAKNWRNSRSLIRNYKYKDIIPDGAFTFEGKEIALEVEFSTKALENRFQPVMNRYCERLYKGYFDKVIYYSDKPKSINEALDKITEVCFNFAHHPFSRYRHKFEVKDINDRPRVSTHVALAKHGIKLGHLINKPSQPDLDGLVNLEFRNGNYAFIDKFGDISYV